ncbi:MAG: TRAM domain-containing protein [Kosmotogaceae bacterium]|nr:TRAM domain-containing protein [Kosmotogaceae bacterium]
MFNRRDDRRGGRGGGRGGFGGRGRGRGGPSYQIPCPVKIGEEYDIEIMEMGSRGDGVTRIKNFVVFVNGAKVGEKIRIKITDIRGRFAVAEKIGEHTGEPAPVEADDANADANADEAETPEESDSAEESTEEADPEEGEDSTEDSSEETLVEGDIDSGEDISEEEIV